MKLIKDNSKGKVYETKNCKIFYRKEGSTSGDNNQNLEETIYLIQGKTKVTLKEKTEIIQAPAEIHFPANTYHKIEAMTDVSFILFEGVDTKEMPKMIQEVGFDFSWDNKKVRALDVLKEKIQIKELERHFNIPFRDTPNDRYNLKPIDVIREPLLHKIEYQRIMNADISYPIDIMENKGRWLILDGLHRLVQCKIRGESYVRVRKIPRELIPSILKEKN